MPVQISLDEKVDMVLAASSEQQIDGKKAVAQFFFTFPGGEDYYFAQNQQTLHVVVGAEKEVVSDPVSVVPLSQDLDEIKEQIRRREKKNREPESSLACTLKAAVDLTFPEWNRAGRVKDYERLMEWVDKFCQQMEIQYDATQVLNRAVDVLSGFFVENEAIIRKISLSVPLPQKPEDMQELHIFADREFIFISVKLFWQIVNPIIQLVSMSELKQIDSIFPLFPGIINRSDFTIMRTK